jgi:endo-1,3-1,4-beta-glycanase ExoK
LLNKAPVIASRDEAGLIGNSEPSVYGSGMKTKSLFVAFFMAAVLAPASAMAMASAELYTTSAYLYGRFDARIQYAPGDGVVSSFFLWKEGSDAANAYWNELDYEKVGANCTMQINNIYGNPKVQHQQTPTFSFNLCSGYHDYRFEWTPDYIAWSVDGKEIRRDTGAAATAYSQNAAAGMSFHFNIWPGNSTFGGNINNTTLPVHQYISWVQYSSYSNGTFNVQWREDFQASNTPSGWGVGTWSSPFNLSTHNPQNVSYVNGIAVLSLTSDNATGVPGTPPVDPAATGGSGGNSGGAGAGAAGTSGAGGVTATGGSKGTGGIIGTGGTSSQGGSSGTGGSGGPGIAGKGGSGGPGTGGIQGSGGTTSTGGSTGSGGTSATGGSTGSGGTTATGGSPGSGGTTGSGGTNATGGEATGGGTSGTTTDQSGCGCSSAAGGSSFGASLFLLFVVVSIVRRRKASRSSSPE